ncbi:hypothetical protein SK128_010551, partial [Halocaridina rubra]
LGRNDWKTGSCSSANLGYSWRSWSEPPSRRSSQAYTNVSTQSRILKNDHTECDFVYRVAGRPAFRWQDLTR